MEKKRLGLVSVGKVIMGTILVGAGIGLIFFQDSIVPVLCSNKIVFGVFLAIAGILEFPRRKIKESRKL